ncbi:hypothetical protein E4U41_004330, partial [Claviceps citrina]
MASLTMPFGVGQPGLPPRTPPRPFTGCHPAALMYELMHGFGVEHLPTWRTRSARVRCGRRRFFQLCGLGEGDAALGGVRLGLVSK